MNLRTKKLVQQFEKLGVDAVLITSIYNRRYLTGFTGSSAYIYISKDRQVLLTDFRYIIQATAQCPDYEIVDYKKLGLIETLQNYLREDSVKSVGFEGNLITYGEQQNLSTRLSEYEWKSIGNVVEEIRMIKSAEEMIYLRKASQIGDEAFSHMLDYIKVGMTEKEIALELEFTMRKLGASANSFDPIIASGVNGALPHARPTDKPIQRGELLTMDFGCIYEGYCSDMTRTIAIGQINEKQKEIYDVVLKAHLESLAALKPGMTGKQLDTIARDIIKDAGYGEYFGHSLGHSVGLEVHESPSLSQLGLTALEEGMLATIEPGIYIEGIGGVRIEDLAVVTANGSESLVTSEKKLITIC